MPSAPILNIELAACQCQYLLTGRLRAFAVLVCDSENLKFKHSECQRCQGQWATLKDANDSAVHSNCGITWPA